LDFYHDLAPFYDEMISFDKRLVAEEEIFISLLKKYPANFILDAGCGSGFHSILLSRLGKKVLGIDLSEEMLRKAVLNAKKYNVAPEFKKADFLEMKTISVNTYDAIYCLGNSFVHLLSGKDQLRALQNFYDRLKRKGYLFIQIINYDKFLNEKRTQLSEKTIGETQYSRSYNYNKNTITFHVHVKSNRRNKKISTELYPLTSTELEQKLKQIGFNKIEFYENLNFQRYERLKSENLCAICS
jgi:SAM-dependent methyltransferase